MKNIKELMLRHADLEIRRAAVEECLTLIRSEFSSRDGIPPNKIVLTEDGKRVPPSTFTTILDEITHRVLAPILNEMSTLEEKRIK
jgi:hypothetical protein